MALDKSTGGISDRCVEELKKTQAKSKVPDESFQQVKKVLKADAELSGNKLNGMITDDDIVAFTKLTSLDLGELDLAGELVQAVQHYEL